MSNKLNAVKEKVNALRQKPLLRTILIAAIVLTLITSVAFAWYINNVDLWGMEFNTGNIDFETYVYDADGNRKVGPVSSDDDEASNTEESVSKYMNAPLISIENGSVGDIGTAYIVVKSTGSIGIQYRIFFGVEGRNEKSNEYLGGYSYNVSKVTEKVNFGGGDYMDVTNCPWPSVIEDEVATIDKNAVNGSIATKDSYEVYRLDYRLDEKNEEYTDGGIKIYFNISATQIDGDFTDGKAAAGITHYCSTKEDIDRVKVEAYPGDTIKLTNNIIYYGDLVFNKPVNLETNDFMLTVNGNLMYDYVLENSLKIDAGGQGRIVVQCTKDGVGGNFQIKAPISDVTLIGSNASIGDIVVEKSVIIDATNSYGAAGVSFHEVRIVNLQNSRKTIQLESNTRATVSFGTTIGIFQSVARANNIEIVNNGEIGEIILSNMSLIVEQTNSPQIFVTNNSKINSPIVLPNWSVKWVEAADGTCTGNTRIIRSFSGSHTEVDGNCEFDNDDIERETKDSLVEQIEPGNDSRLRIYYQDANGKTNTIQSILEEYLLMSGGCAVHEVLQLEIVSIDDKPVTNKDIAFMNSDSMLSLKQLDLLKATIHDSTTDTDHRLPASAFYGVSKYDELILPQNLLEIGSGAFQNSKIENIVTIPSGVTVFGSNWFRGGYYVRFAASTPLTEAQANSGLSNVKAIFVDEAYIASYKTVFSGYATQIYPTSVLDETKHHFVRNIRSDEWEITYYIKDEGEVIGENVTIDGTSLKITSVYDHAYRHTFTGTKVRFADSVENLGAGNFYHNKNITEADLNHLKYIGNEAFSNNSALAKVTFGDSLVTIGANAFLNCISLNQDVDLPKTMQKIGMSAFRKTKIISLKAGGTVSIDGMAFFECAELRYAELPNLKVVGEDGNNRLFESCVALVSVKVPSLTTVKSNRLFALCGSLREVYMAATDEDTSLGAEAFLRCDMTRLKLYVPEEHIDFYRTKQPGSISASMIYPQGEKMGEQFVKGYDIGTYIVGDNGDGSYTLITSNIDYTDTMSIPKTFKDKPITGIYDNAFRNQGFNNVTVKLGDNVQVIGSNAFYQLSGLVGVEFGSSVKTIGAAAFAECPNLVQKIQLPDSMERIEKEAFRGTGILSVNTGGTTTVEGVAFANCASLVNVIMPEVTTIGANGTNDIFSTCTSLVSVDMPKVHEASGEGIFRYCSSLAEIYLSSDDANVTIGNNPFPGIDTAKKAKLKLFVPAELVTFYQGRNIVSSNQIYPRGEKIGTKSIYGFVVGDYVVCENDDGYTLVTSNLEPTGTVIVPDQFNNKPITEIYANAFRNQTFTDAHLVLGENLKTIGNNAFCGAAGLKSIVMDQVTTIGAEAFYGSGIQSLNAPKLTSIGNSAFRLCTDLEMVSIPKIENIESSYVFAECTELKSVYFEDVMTLNSHTFYEDKKLEKITINRQINSNGDNMPTEMTIDSEAPCKIYVPYRSRSLYTDRWSGKPVVSFDISATYNGDTYILSDDNGRYVLIAFETTQTPTALTLPTTVSAPEIGNISIYSIANGAFAAVADKLKALTLSSTVVQLEGAALSECTALENIYVSADNTYFTSVDGVLYSKDAKLLAKYPAGRSTPFDMTSGDYASTVAIGAGAFTNAMLNEIVFPSTLMVVDSTAFTNCKLLNKVEFTGNTPPILLGAGTFDTSVQDFKMVIPTTNSSVITTYLYAYNFGEYEPYITLPGTYVKPMQNLDLSVGVTGIWASGETLGSRGLKIADFAQDYVGCPYVYGGSTPSGFDCSGFVQYVYMHNGISINRTATDQLQDGYRVSYADMRPGDVVYFGSGDIATHVGIYIGDGEFVHAQNPETGVVISSLSEEYYADNFLCARRIVE